MSSAGGRAGVDWRNSLRRTSKYEIDLGEVDQSFELDLEVGPAIACNVAFDDCLVLSGSGVVDLDIMQLAFDVVEIHGTNNVNFWSRAFFKLASISLRSILS